MKNSKAADRIFDVSNGFVMVIIFIIMVYPFWYIIVKSVSNPDLSGSGLIFFPVGFTLEYYTKCFVETDIVNGLLISVARTVIGSAGMIIVTSMAAYVLSKNHFIGVRFFRKFIIFTMYFSGGIIPVYLVIKSLHLTNNFLVYILPLLLNAYNLILIRAYIESLPSSLEESALIDGANDAEIFFKIIFPLCMPVIAAVTLYVAIQQWNSFIDTQLYNSMNRRLFTLQYVLYNYMANMYLTLEEAKGATIHLSPMSIRMAVTTITMLPILLIFPFVQKYFISGLLIGSVKE